MRSISSFSSSFFSSSCTKTSPKNDVKNEARNTSKPSAPAPRHCTGHSSSSHFEHAPSKHSSCHKPSPSIPSPSIPSPSIPSPSIPSSGTSTPPVISSDCKAALDRMGSVLDAQTNTTKDNGATVTANAANVEDRNSKRLQSAQALVTANASLEQAQLSKLPQSERDHYNTVRDSLTQANNPVAALSLQKMLFSGRLEQGKDLLDQGSVLDHLSQIAQGQNLDKRVDGKLLLSDLVQELATPSCINQGARGTCAPTATAIDLNITHPAEYARLMQGLASPSGEVTTASKQTLRREADTSFKDDHSSRALTQRLLAPAIMEVANQDNDYHDSADSAHRNAGATSKGVQILSNMLFGGGWDYKNVNDKNRDEAMAQLQAEVKQKQNVMIGMHYGQSNTSGHELLVTGFETVNGKQYVDYTNPWGQEERMTRDNFERRLTGMTFDTRPV